MKLVKKIDLKGCGTGRQVRFGHLLGNGEYQTVSYTHLDVYKRQH